MKPILYNIFAIDATKDNDVLFVWNGLQAIGSILTIKEVGNSSFVKIISHKWDFKKWQNLLCNNTGKIQGYKWLRYYF